MINFIKYLIQVYPIFLNLIFPEFNQFHHHLTNYLLILFIHQQSLALLISDYKSQEIFLAK